MPTSINEKWEKGTQSVSAMSHRTAKFPTRPVAQLLGSNGRFSVGTGLL
jgi:hypothetical protein